MVLRTRFAPSPTGDLHVGGAFTALAAWWLARSTGGATVLRVEDLDAPRVVAGAEARQREDLAWLGLDWDEGGDASGPEGPYRQSERTALYAAALDDLTAQGRTYPCDCSRAEIARGGGPGQDRIASAPHTGEEVPYPGSCRDRDPARPLRRPAATRLRIEADDFAGFTDGVLGAVDTGLLQAAGDFVLRRGDGVYAYQLAVAADDLAMGITGIPRGDDLVASTPRQLLLMQLWRARGALAWACRLDQPFPRYWHLPLVRASDGSRLAKRTPAATVRELSAMGVRPGEVVGQLAWALGLILQPEAMTPRELLAKAPAGAPFRREPWRVASRWR